MKIKLFTIVFVCSLGACAEGNVTPEDIRNRAQMECIDLGFQEGSSKYIDCYFKLYSKYMNQVFGRQRKKKKAIINEPTYISPSPDLANS